jgi:spermidine synthase
LPLHQLDLDTLRSIVRSFLVAWPRGYAVLATNSLETPVVGLVGQGDGVLLAVNQVPGRLADPTLRRAAAELGIFDDLSLLGSFIASPRSLAHFARTAPLNTDDRPVVVYRAPRIAYAADSLPRDRLIALLREADIRPDELVAGRDDPRSTARLAAYWAARNRFIEAGRNVEPTSDVHRMLAQVREPLLSVLRLSPEFRPAYDPLLRMAIALAASDVAEARALLQELQAAEPSRPEAGEALRNLSDAR